MNQEQKNLLMYLDHRRVDYEGRVNMAHVNDEDLEIIEEWKSNDFIDFGRIKSGDHNSDGTHWVELSQSAIDFVNEFRTERAERMERNRTYRRTSEE